MADSVVGFKKAHSPSENRTQGESSFVHQKENEKIDVNVKASDSKKLVSGGGEMPKGELKEVLDAKFLEDSSKESLVRERIYSFYFVKQQRMYDDPAIMIKIQKADKEIRKRNKYRLGLVEQLRAKKASRAEIITSLKSLKNDEKQCKASLDEKNENLILLQQTLRNLDCTSIPTDYGIPSNEKEVKGHNYNIQHDNIYSAEENQLQEITQLEGMWEEGTANFAIGASTQDPSVYIESIQEQVNLISIDLEDMPKQLQALQVNIKLLDGVLRTMNSDITVLLEELNTATERRDKAVERIRELKSQNELQNSSFIRYCKVIGLAKSFALIKDIQSLEHLSSAEVENFMSNWNSNKSFRDDYIQRKMSSSAHLSKFGRNSDLDGKRKAELDVLGSFKLEAIRKADVKEGNKHPKIVVQQDISPNKNGWKRSKDVLHSESKLDYTNTEKQAYEAENLIKDFATDNEVDIEKMMELKREEEMAKAKQAMERKRRLAEKAAAKATLKAQKEAERKIKERERKAKKKDGVSIVEELNEISGGALDQEVDNGKVEATATLHEKVQNENAKRKNRIKSKAPESIPKVILKRRRSSDIWIWVTVAVFVSIFVALAVLGYQSLP